MRRRIFNAPHRAGLAELWGSSGTHRPFAGLTITERKTKIALAVAATDGNIRRAAAILLCKARLVYRYINRYALWPVVNEARRARRRRTEQERMKTTMRRKHKI